MNVTALEAAALRHLIEILGDAVAQSAARYDCVSELVEWASRR